MVVVSIGLLEADPAPMTRLRSRLIEVDIDERVSQRSSSSIASGHASLDQTNRLLGDQLDSSQGTRLEVLGRLLESGADHRLGAVQ